MIECVRGLSAESYTASNGKFMDIVVIGISIEMALPEGEVE